MVLYHGFLPPSIANFKIRSKMNFFQNSAFCCPAACKSIYFNWKINIPPRPFKSSVNLNATKKNKPKPAFFVVCNFVFFGRVLVVAERSGATCIKISARHGCIFAFLIFLLCIFYKLSYLTMDLDGLFIQ